MVETRKFAAGRNTNSAEKAPALPKAYPEAVGQKTLIQVLVPIQDQLLSAGKLDTLCTWLNDHRTSWLAIQIMQDQLCCFGRPVGIGVPYVCWNSGRFGRYSALAGYGWRSTDRAALLG